MSLSRYVNPLFPRPGRGRTVLLTTLLALGLGASSQAQVDGGAQPPVELPPVQVMAGSAPTPLYAEYDKRVKAAEQASPLTS